MMPTHNQFPPVEHTYQSHSPVQIWIAGTSNLLPTLDLSSHHPTAFDPITGPFQGQKSQNDEFSSYQYPARIEASGHLDGIGHTVSGVRI